MDIALELTGPSKLDKKTAMNIAKRAAGSKKCFRQLLGIILSENKICAGRAAWCFSLAAELNRDWADTMQAELIALLALNGPEDMVLRNVLRTLRGCKILSEHFDAVAFYCFDYLEDERQSIAIRAFALHILGQICKSVPELKPELKAIINFRFLDEHKKSSAGLKSAARTVLKGL